MTKSQDFCWCASITDTKLFAYFTAEELPGIIYDYEHYESQPTARNDRGEAIAADELPKKFFSNYRGIKHKLKPYVFIAYGFYVVSAAVANILRQFDLGQGALYPVELFHYDRETKVEGEYFLINYGNAREVVLPNWSKNIFPYPAQRLPWRPYRGFGDDDITLSVEAKTCPDIWMDPRLKHTFFFSNRLVAGLRAEKKDKRWRFVRCIISEMPASEGGL